MLRDMFRIEGHLIGRKRVSRLMKKMRTETLYRKPNLSRRHAEHPIYRYLLSRSLTPIKEPYYKTRR